MTVGHTADEIVAGIVERLEAARDGAAPDSASRSYVAAHFDWAESARKVEGALAAASGARAIPAAGRAEGC